VVVKRPTKYPRAHIHKVPPEQAGRLWLHARWWITYELRPGVFLSWDEGVPIVTHHTYYGDTIGDAVRTVAQLRHSYGQAIYDRAVVTS